MKRILAVISCFSALVMMSFMITKDEVRYKNLKILPKNTDKRQMDSVMKHFSQSLGVRCNYCHVFNQEQKAMDFASDGNEHKKIARDMMRMTNKLNKKYFDIKNSSQLDARLEVTCYSCHHGQTHVARKPQPTDQRGPQGPGPRPFDQPRPQEQRNPADSAAHQNTH